MTGFALDSYAFGLSQDKTKVSPLPYVEKIAENLPFKLIDTEDLNEDSLTMTLSGERLKEINYEVSSMGNNGKEKIVFDYAESGKEIQAPSEVMTLLENMTLDYKDPTNWKEENQNIYDTLVDFYGEVKIVDSLPYLYVADVTGYWSESFMGTSVMVSASNSTYDVQTFNDAYIALLKKEGFEEGKDMYDATIYHKGTVAIKLSESSLSISFLKYTPSK